MGKARPSQLSFQRRGYTIEAIFANSTDTLQRKLPSAEINAQLKDWQTCMTAGPRSADTDKGGHRGWPKAGICARYRDAHKLTVDHATSWANRERRKKMNVHHSTISRVRLDVPANVLAPYTAVAQHPAPQVDKW